MATTEHTINDALAGALRKTRHLWRKSRVVRSEQSGMLRESSGRPDILIVEQNMSPVAMEAEVMPAISVEEEAASRLGQYLSGSGRLVLSSIAVRLPTRIREREGLELAQEMENAADLEMALLTGSSPLKSTRWPRSGWIKGDISDLSILAQTAAIPPEVIDKAADQLVAGVQNAAGLLNEMAEQHPGAISKIGQELCQEDGEQTRRMASTILANAFMFHEILAGGKGELADVNSIEELRGAGKLTKSSVLGEWRKILRINYWPIFDIARRMLEAVPTGESKPLIETLAQTADRLLQNRLMRSHDLTGAVFQRLIADRQFLAAYYTTPASASLLVGLAITPEMLSHAGKSWSNADDVVSLRVADFACGTGTLLSSAYHRISQLHELAGGDSELLHPRMMADSLIGCDVLPAAAHLTASMLSGAHPTVKYNGSCILTVAYGKQPDGSIALGSLDLLDKQGRFDIIAVTAKAAQGMGESEKETWQSLPHASFDVVIMNPPFTRATAHEGETEAVPNPIFAAFGSSAEEQRLMAQATERLTRGTAAHGNAGEASIFLVLADRKLKPNGKLALVMPLSLMAGESWEEARKLMARNYSNLMVVSIAGHGDDEMAFSADTGMAECLVIGEKSIKGSSRATFAILNERPAYSLVGANISQQIMRLEKSSNIHRLEDGPIGGTPIYFGDNLVGQLLDAPLPSSGGWHISRIRDLSLIQAAYQMAIKQRFWLPGMQESKVASIPVTKVGDIAATGPIDRDINGLAPNGGIRGPFDIVPLTSGKVPTYPVLWSHDAERERSISFDGESEGISRLGSNLEEKDALARKVEAVWESASHCHFNCNFRFNSQSTGMQFTPRLTIGGTAWLSLKLESPELEKVLVLWGNTSMGLLLRWWYSNKQQAGRGRIGKSMVQSMPILDVTALTADQVKKANMLFDSICGKKLLPIHEIHIDPVRKELDEQFALNILNLNKMIVEKDGPLDLLRMKLAQEPSIRGKK